MRGAFWAVLAMSIGFGAVLAPVDAEAQTEGGLPPQVVIFVIDLSGSMNEPFGEGQTKLDVAKDSFAEAFSRASESAFVGVRVYGDQLAAQPPGAREQNCTEDTRLVVAVAELDAESVIEQVRGFTARGDTPIALALRAANEDIPDGTVGTVVLFSDGRDECYDADLDGNPDIGPSWGENPCDVAREIAGVGVDLRIDRIDTVGFGADSAAETELRCIADSTGGAYTPIESAADARNILPDLLANLSSPRAAERLGGEPIVGTPSVEGAPEFPRLDGPAPSDGRFTDTITMGSEKWYRVPEYGPGAGTFTATVFGLPAQEGITLGMYMYLPETDQMFFTRRNDENAGVPLRPTASIRCPGCSVTGGPNDVYWVVYLQSENPDMAGEFDLELLIEGPAFGGLSTECREPQACWYEQRIEDLSQSIIDLESEYESLVAGGDVQEELIAQRNELAEEMEELEARAIERRALADNLESLLTEQEAPTSLAIPLVLLVIGLGLGVFGLVRSRSAALSPAGQSAGASTASSGSAVIGRLETEPVTERKKPGDESSGAPAESQESPGDLPTEPPTAAVDETTAEPQHPADTETGPPDELPGSGPLEVPEPGWYNDPDGGGRLRWWDGSQWTDDYHAPDGGAS